MTNVQAEEVPFLTGMEREGPVCETTIEVGRKAFRLDGVLDRLLAKARAALEARAQDRGPDPDVNLEDEERILVPVRVFEQAMKRPPPSYSNGSPEESNWKTIALLVLSFLQVVVLAIMGWLCSTTSQTHDDVIRIKCRLDPQSCMGSQNVRP